MAKNRPKTVIFSQNSTFSIKNSEFSLFHFFTPSLLRPFTPSLLYFFTPSILHFFTTFPAFPHKIEAAALSQFYRLAPIRPFASSNAQAVFQYPSMPKRQHLAAGGTKMGASRFRRDRLRQRRHVRVWAPVIACKNKVANDNLALAA
jgi:hypothetical protein